MESGKTFFKFIGESLKDFKAHFSVYLSTYIFFLLINFVSITPWEALGFPDKSGAEVMTSIIIGLLSLVALTNIILIEKGRIKVREKEKLLYAAPTYLIYTLYSSLIVLVFFSLLFLLPKSSSGAMNFMTYGKFAIAAIPACIAGVCVTMVPLSSVLIDNDSINYFKLSFTMAKNAPFLVLLVGASSLLIELPSVLIDFLPSWQAQLGAGFLYSFVDPVLVIVLTKASIAVFYYLKKQLVGESVY